MLALTESKFDEAREFMFSGNKPPEILELFANLHKIHTALQEEATRATTPIGVFVDSMTPIQKRMVDILPKKAVCDQLVNVYIRGTETIFRFLVYRINGSCLSIHQTTTEALDVRPV